MDRSQSNITLGVFLVIASQFFSASVMTAVKVVSVRIPTLDVIFASYSISLCCVVFVMLAKRDIGFKTKHLSLQLMRSVFGALYFGGLFWAVTYIPVVDTILLRSTAPIWAPIIAYLWLKQPFHQGVWPRIMIAFLGVVLILHPTLVHVNPGYFIALFAAVSYAFSGTLIKQLNQIKEPLFRTLFYSFLVPSLVLLPYAITHVPEMITAFDLLLLVFIGLGTLALLLLYVSALRYASILIVLPLTYTGVVFAAIYDWFLWQQAPNTISMIGMVLVFVGCFSIVRLESRQST